MKKLHAAHHPGPKAFMDAINTRTACIFAASCLHPVGYVSSPGQTRQLIWTCREKNAQVAKGHSKCSSMKSKG